MELKSCDHEAYTEPFNVNKDIEVLDKSDTDFAINEILMICQLEATPFLKMVDICFQAI